MRSGRRPTSGKLHSKFGEWMREEFFSGRIIHYKTKEQMLRPPDQNKKHYNKLSFFRHTAACVETINCDDQNLPNVAATKTYNRPSHHGFFSSKQCWLNCFLKWLFMCKVLKELNILQALPVYSVFLGQKSQISQTKKCSSEKPH